MVKKVLKTSVATKLKVANKRVHDLELMLHNRNSDVEAYQAASEERTHSLQRLDKAMKGVLKTGDTYKKVINLQRSEMNELRDQRITAMDDLATTKAEVVFYKEECDRLSVQLSADANSLASGSGEVQNTDSKH